VTDPRQALERDARRFEQALREDWARVDPRLRDLLARRPQWVELLEDPPAELLSTGAHDGPDRRLTDELLALARRTPRPVVRRRGAPWLLAAAAVAVCLGGLAWWNLLGTQAPEQVQRLGGSDHGSASKSAVACVVQAPSGPERGILRWKLAEPLSADRSIEIVVRECAQVARTGRELARKIVQPSVRASEGTESRWKLDPQVLAQASDCFEWTVTLLDASGHAIASDSARVERSSR
jgi:hypothetical protein